MTTLRLRPRILLRNFPPEVRESVPSLSPEERGLGLVISLSLMTILIGIPVWSAMRTFDGNAPFSAVFVHAFCVSLCFDLVDWLILDELWIGWIRPPWIMPAGAEDLRTFRFDHGRHFRGFLIGAALAALTGALAGALHSWS